MPTKYIRHMDPAVISDKCRKSALMVKHHNGGRKKGGKNKNSLIYGCSMDEPRTQMMVLRASRDILSACAKTDGVSMVVFIKRLTDQLKTHPRYAHLFAEAKSESTGLATETDAHSVPTDMPPC